MTSINRQAPTTATRAVGTPAGAAPPAYLAGLLAANPNLARDLKADPGLRTFLEHNKANIVEFGGQPPAGKVADTVTWETWCHTTTIVPANVRDEEYIVIVARGSAYKNAAEVEFPLTNGKTAHTDGRIVYVGKTKDLLGTQKKADENGHYPGAITVDVTMQIAGTPGEKISLAYSRVTPNANGAVNGSQSGWPPSVEGGGVWSGFAGRELDVKLAGGRKQFAESPDGCSTMGVAKLV